VPKIATQLSDRAVAAIKTEGRHPVGGVPGLHIRVTGGHKGWVLRVKVGESRRDLGLGAYPIVSLAEARQKARDVHSSLQRGELPTTPAKQRMVALVTASKTFAQCAEGFMRDREGEWKNPKHRQQWENTLSSYAYPHFGSLPVVTSPAVSLAASTVASKCASLMEARACQFADWFFVTPISLRVGVRSSLSTALLPMPWAPVAFSVCASISPALRCARTRISVAYHRALPIDEMPAFMMALRQREGIAARALEFCILTCARSSESRGVTWLEVDLDAGVWVVPAHRMKAGREHRVPLSEAAIKLLTDMPRLHGTELVFPGQKGQQLSDMSINAVLRRMGVNAVPHGFRSSFRDWAGDRTAFPRDLAEAALAHTLGKVEAAYRRGDALEKRRAMMEQWARHCEGVANG
jgi:integrase